MDMTSRVAIVTGASRGIGAATARHLGACGAHVVVNYHTKGDLAQAVVDSIVDSGGRAEALCFDVSDEAAVKAAIGDIVARHGRIDCLVNNAGISQNGLMLRFRVADYDRIMDANLKSAFLCASYCIRYMAKRRYGRIVNLSSVVGMGGNTGQAVYAASKAGIIGLTKSLAKEFASRGILVNAIAPGMIDTDMTGDLDIEKAGIHIPLKRKGRPEEVASAIVFLCSDMSSYMTGQIMVVDGGMYT
ncbi:MAG: 3-oxoacyl-ACP reductase family protein [Thermodesulfobacteriota bacterium]|nr:3-oxoacyl-ACP reductase family protein [Thermodesulfobacteriota bacterium]